MVDPINYSQQVQQPLEAAMQGYQFGAGIRNDQAQQDQKLAQQQAAQQQQQALQALASNPNATGQDYARVMTANPALAEHLQKAWTVKNTEQQQAYAADLLQWGSAIAKGQPQIAVDQMNARADALEQAGKTQDAQVLRAHAQSVVAHPEYALGNIQSQLAANPNGKQAADTQASFGAEKRAEDMAKPTLEKAQAEATTAGVNAKYADSKAIADLQKTGWDITKIQSDIGIAKEANRIAAMNAATSRAGNDLKREELQLKITEAKQGLEDKIRAKVSEAQSGATTIDNLLNSIQKVQGNKALNDVIGSMEGSKFYPTQLMGMANIGGSSSDDRADAIRAIETLGSQIVQSQLSSLKGLGPASDKDVDNLRTSLVNLSREQSEPSFRGNLNEASRLVLKLRDNLSTKTGIPLPKPDTPAAPGARPPLSDFQK